MPLLIGFLNTLRQKNKIHSDELCIRRGIVTIHRIKYKKDRIYNG